MRVWIEALGRVSRRLCAVSSRGGSRSGYDKRQDSIQVLMMNSCLLPLRYMVDVGWMGW